MIWPFSKRKKPPKPEQPLSLVSEPSEREKIRWFFREDELEKSVVFTETVIVETVSPEDTKEPVFRDDFFYLCGRLRDREHPFVPRLLDFGEENGRLYRAWERRPLQNFLCKVASQTLRRESLIQIHLESLDGFLHMRELGLPLTPELLHGLSIDSKGCFPGRVPLTIKSNTSLGDIYNFGFVMNSFCPDKLKAIWKGGAPILQDIAFQFSLGTLLWVAWSDRFPFRYPPGSAVPKGVEPERLPFDFGPALTPVLTRLTEPDSGKRYPTLETAFEALREALEKYCD